MTTNIHIDDDVVDAISSKFITLANNETVTGFFLTGNNTKTATKRIRVEHTKYNDEPVEKIHFELITMDNLEKGRVTEEAVQFLNVGKRSARLIVPEIKQGNQLLRVKRTGNKNETMYTPSVVENPNLVALVEKHRAALNKLQPVYDNGNGNDNGSTEETS